MATQTNRSKQRRTKHRCVEALTPHDLASRVCRAHTAQQRWSQTPLKQRLRVIRSMRHELAAQAELLTASVSFPRRNGPAETLAGELIPLADACRFLERTAKRLLAPQRFSNLRRPLWLFGVSVEVLREPLGTVLIVGAANYPLFLPGVQALQALAAGNAVLIKPALGAAGAVQALKNSFVAAGLDEALVQVLPEDEACVESVVNAGIQKVILTGSAETGCRVQSLLAGSLTPATMELSGCDAVFVLESADLDRVAQCLSFGLRFNGSATCIAPRRVFVPQSLLPALEASLTATLRNEAIPDHALSDRTSALIADAIESGARRLGATSAGEVTTETRTAATVLTNARAQMSLLQSDVCEPVISLVPVESMDAALRADDECPFALGAVVFGEAKEAEAIARRINAGCVVINDMIAPTADPRVPFGGRGRSGFGTTRGAAGLLELTQIKTLIHRKNNWLPHLDKSSPHDADLLCGFLRFNHGGDWMSRLQAAWSAFQAGTKQRKWAKQQRRLGHEP